jgi:PmbA protein
MSGGADLEATARLALEGAIRRGVRDVRAVVDRSRNVSVTYRDGRPDRVQESSRRSLALHLYLDGRYSACVTNDLRPSALDDFLDRAVGITRAMVPDRFREITDPSLYRDRAALDLAVYDPRVQAIEPDLRHRLAREAHAAAVEAAGDRGISAEASFEDEHEESYRLHSNGFEGYERATQAWLSVEITLSDEGDRRPDGWDVAGSRSLAGLPAPRLVGEGAARRAGMRLKATKGATATLPIILENRAAGRLLGSLLGAASARAFQQRESFLEGMIGKEVGSGLLELVDDPFVAGGFGSRLYDSEGISARRLPIFEGGVLAGIYADTYYARKLGCAPTTGSRSNLVMSASGRPLEELARAIHRGVLVRGFVGGNSNPTTGDFSFGVYGNAVEGGELGGALMEMNVSGNHRDLWRRLAAVGGDVWRFGSLLVPSLVIEGVQVSGA